MTPIELRGVRTHNLRDVTIRLVPGTWTALCGVSGSGKSSLAFHTLHAEAERRWWSALPQARFLGEGLARPPLEGASGLLPSAALRQDHQIPGPRTTLATLAGLEEPLAALWAAAAVPISPASGLPMRLTEAAEVVDKVLAEAPGERLQVLFRPAETERSPALWTRRGFVRGRAGGPGAPVRELAELPDDPAELHLVVDRLVAEVRHAERLSDSVQTAYRLGDDLCEVEILPRDGSPSRSLRFSRRPTCPESGLSAPRPRPALFSRRSAFGACPACGGTGGEGASCPACGGSGLRPETHWFRLDGMSLPEWTESECGEALAATSSPAWVALEEGPCRDLVREIRDRLTALAELGLAYLSPSRPGRTLSHGELRRARLAGLVGSPLAGLAYVLDEPGTGLHPRDLPRLHGLLARLRDGGATLVVVEHDLHGLGHCDRVLETGPGAGPEGGWIVADTLPAELPSLPTPSGRWLAGLDRPLPRLPGPATGRVELRGARGRNLRGVDLVLEGGRLVGICGVSGSGKSSLLLDTLAPALERYFGREAPAPLPHDGLRVEGIASVEIHDPHGEASRTPRSLVATAAGLLDEWRTLFASLPEAKARGWNASRFSPNNRGGRCEHCEGLGQKRVELHLLPDAWIPCEACEGRRFNRETLQVRWKGLDLSELLDLPLARAAALFETHPRIGPRLARLDSAGLGHIQAGRRVDTLSGGELLRLRLAASLAGGGDPRLRRAHLFDEPSRGLHPRDTTRLLGLLRELADAGHAVALCSHDPFLLSRCDRLLELGPGAGREGGNVCFEGTPQALASSGSPSSEAVARELAA